MVGRAGSKVFGIDDPRHVVMVAGSRSGKTSSMLLPNLLAYPGPCVVIDPKGELVAATAAARERFGGQGSVHVLDPFGITGRQSSGHNPFDELKRSKEGNLPADAAQIADALIVESDGKNSHWTDSAKNLIKGLVLYLLDKETDPEKGEPGEATVRRLRELLNETPPTLYEIFETMASSDKYDGAMGNVGGAFLSMVNLKDGIATTYTEEMRSILSTARQQTGPLDDVAKVMDESSFSLADIGRKNLTVYLVLPAGRIGTHFRWLRLFIMQAFAAMEANSIPRGKPPVWFVLEEFAALGHVQAIETASGYMAGFGVKLWVILQDLTQLRRHYEHSWETFLGNAGVTLAFGNIDATTTEYISRQLGVLEYEHPDNRPIDSFTVRRVDQPMVKKVGRLLEPHEVREFFGARSKRVLVMAGEHPPVALLRFDVPGGHG